MKKAESIIIKEKVIQLLSEGKTYHEIADELKMKYDNLISFFYRHEIKMDPNNLWKHQESEKLKQIKAELKSNQLKQSDIARKFNVSRQYIHEIKKQMVEEND